MQGTAQMQLLQYYRDILIIETNSIKSVKDNKKTTTKNKAHRTPLGSHALKCSIANFLMNTYYGRFSIIPLRLIYEPKRIENNG